MNNLDVHVLYAASYRTADLNGIVLCDVVTGARRNHYRPARDFVENRG
jgi:hypothetical protein